MADIEMLTIRTELDGRGFDDLEQRASSSLDKVRAGVDRFNKKAQVKGDVEPLLKNLARLRGGLDELGKTAASVALSLKAPSVLEGPALEALERHYAERVRLAGRCAREIAQGESATEAELLALRQDFLRRRLDLLQSEAGEAVRLGGEASEALIGQIGAVRAELASLEGAGSGFGRALGASFASAADTMVSALGSALSSMAANLNSYAHNIYDARIRSLDAALQRERGLIDTALKEQLALYERQLEAFAGIEEAKERLKREHADRIEHLNGKMQEHLTEEQWRSLEEQLLAERGHYEESMLALEEDAVRRDEIRAAREQAEAEALARKEALETDYANRRAAMERKQAQMERQTSLFSAVINVAEGVSRAWAQGGALFGPAFAALVAAAGAVQIAAITSRPLPEIPSFRQGGTIGADNAHRYPWLPPADNPHDRTLFWGQSGEEVLNLKEAASYRALRQQGFSLDALARRVRAGAAMAGDGFGREGNAAGRNGHASGRAGGNNVGTGGTAETGGPVITQNVTITARNELTFGEARRLLAHQSRCLARALG